MPVEKKWYYSENKERRGPIMEEQIAGLIINGAISGATLVWTKGMEKWQSAGTTALAAYLSRADVPPPLEMAYGEPPPFPVTQTGSGGKNVFYSIFITIGILFLASSLMFAISDSARMGVRVSFILISSIVMAVLAYKYKTKMYKGLCFMPPLQVLTGCIILWLIVFPCVLYAILEIKDGRGTLKDKYR
jgi:hypothetical protein